MGGQSGYSASRRRFLWAGGAVALGGAALLVGKLPPWQDTPEPLISRGSANAARQHLLLAGPSAPVSLPLMRMVESGALAHLAQKVEFRLWNNPDQLRALAIRGEADLIATPSNVAANLYNRKIPIRLLEISVWKLLWLVTRQPRGQTLADYRDEEILVPFRSDMPDILFGLLARAQGLRPDKDFRIRHTATPMEAMQLLISRRAQHALLAEPAVSMALHKTRSLPMRVVAPELHRGLDLQQEWGRVFERTARIPMAGIAALGATLADSALLQALQSALQQAHLWCRDNPQACGEMAARHAPMLLPEAVSAALQIAPLQRQSGTEVRAELEFFYRQLLQVEPGLMGGALPGDDFYA